MPRHASKSKDAPQDIVHSSYFGMLVAIGAAADADHELGDELCAGDYQRFEAGVGSPKSKPIRSNMRFISDMPPKPPKTPKPNKTANQIAGKISKNCKKIKQKISKTSKPNFLMLNFLGN